MFRIAILAALTPMVIWQAPVREDTSDSTLNIYGFQRIVRNKDGRVCVERREANDALGEEVWVDELDARATSATYHQYLQEVMDFVHDSTKTDFLKHSRLKKSDVEEE